MTDELRDKIARKVSFKICERIYNEGPIGNLGGAMVRAVSPFLAAALDEYAEGQRMKIMDLVAQLRASSNLMASISELGSKEITECEAGIHTLREEKRLIHAQQLENDRAIDATTQAEDGGEDKP